MYNHIVTPIWAVILSKDYSQVCIHSLNFTPDTLDNAIQRTGATHSCLAGQASHAASTSAKTRIRSLQSDILSGQLDIESCNWPLGQHRILDFQLLHVCTVSSCRHEMWYPVATTNGLVRGSSDNHRSLTIPPPPWCISSPTRLGLSLNKTSRIPNGSCMTSMGGNT